ncbi:MAG TPA: FHA domain-containing protein, partial [Myxococcota bacterium]|nr:FHA domain-containing protein [Myxococcota bacterium]
MSAESESRPVEWILQSLSPEDGVDREPILGADGLEIGRTASGLAFPDDLAMADRHAALEVSAEGVTVRDLSDGEGIWVRVRGTQGQLLEDGDQVWLGSQILLVERSGEGWAVRHYGPEGRLRERHPLSEPGVLIGRGSALTLDVHDTRLSRRHAQLLIEGASLRLFDRGAHNGTYLKLRGQGRLVEGDELRLGTQHFRLAARAVAAPESRPASDAAPAPEAEGAPVARPVALRRGGLAARLRRMGRDLRPGEGPGFEPDRVGEDAVERPPP